MTTEPTTHSVEFGDRIALGGKTYTVAPSIVPGKAFLSEETALPTEPGLYAAANQRDKLEVATILKLTPGGWDILGYEHRSPQAVKDMAARWARNHGLVRVYLTAENPAAKPAAVKLIDREGDTWVPVEGKNDRWHCPTAEWVGERTHDYLKDVYGPLTEVSA